MKKIQILLLTIAIIGFSACKKERSAPSPDIFGIWEWKYSLTAQNDMVKPSTHAIVQLKLNADSSYTLSLNNKYISSGTFSTNKWSSISYIVFSNYLDADKLYAGLGEAYKFDQGVLLFYQDYAPDMLGVIISHSFTRLP